MTDLRWALGDNGKRMQPELVEYARQIKKDADEAVGLREALRELVALEDMRLRLRKLHEMGHGTDYDNYHRRLPKAWDAARAALGPNVKDERPP
jgi:hypothetical protein